MTDDARTDGEYDDRPRTHRYHHDGDGAITTTVAFAVADVDDVDPSRMEPLYSVVDPELLEALGRDDRQVSGDVMFDYRGHRVTVDSDGGIVVRAAAPGESP